MLQTRERRVTQKDIARAAKLSIAAVSMALKGHNELPQSTIARVRRIADELGYAPDPALSALVARRSAWRRDESFSVFAYVTPNEEPNTRGLSPSSKLLGLAAGKRAKELGYRLESFSVAPDAVSLACLGKVLSDRGIRGLVLAPELQISKKLDSSWNELCAVSLRSQNDAAVHCVVPDTGVDLERCWQKLVDKGYRKIGLLLDSDDGEGLADELCLSHMYSHIRHGINVNSAPSILRVDETIDAAKLRAWITEEKLDAIVSNRSGTRSLLLEAGYDTPQALAFISMNNSEEPEGTSGIRRRTEEISTLAIDTLNSLIQLNRFGPTHTPTSLKVAGRWQEGGSY